MAKTTYLYISLIIILLVSSVISGCNKKTDSEEDLIIGTWIRESTDGTGPGNTLYFSKKNGIYTLSFNCSGSPGPGWPSNAETEYKFQNEKLTYLNYYDPGLGFYTANNFRWVTKAQEFELLFREMLLYMSATYLVKYKKVS